METIKYLQDRVDLILVDGELKKRAEEASKKADELTEGLKQLKTMFTDKFNDVNKTAEDVQKELKNLQDEANPEETSKQLKELKQQLTELKGDVTNLSSDIEADKSSFRGMKVATWVMLALFAVIVIGQIVFLYRKQIISKFRQTN